MRDQNLWYLIQVPASEEFVQSLLALHIDHSSSSAYMAKTNGRAEKAVQLVKKMLLMNPPRSAKNLQKLTSAVNNRPSGVPGGGSSYERFFGRLPLLLLPCLPKPLTPEVKSMMAEKMAKHREGYRAKYAHTRLVEYKIDDEVLCFDPKMKSFCKEGKVLSYDPTPSDHLGPRNYMIEFKEGGPGGSTNSG